MYSWSGLETPGMSTYPQMDRPIPDDLDKNQTIVLYSREHKIFDAGPEPNEGQCRYVLSLSVTVASRFAPHLKV